MGILLRINARRIDFELDRIKNTSITVYSVVEVFHFLKLKTMKVDYRYYPIHYQSVPFDLTH